jgi:hypothetical protein
MHDANVPQGAAQRNNTFTASTEKSAQINANPLRTRLISWKAVRKNSLRGFASIELPTGLRIFDIPVLSARGKVWAALPSKPQLEDGQHRRDINGKPAYSPVLEWRSRDLADRFSAAVIALVNAQHSADLADEVAQ